MLTIPGYYAAVLVKAGLNICLLSSLLHEPIGGFNTQVSWYVCLFICLDNYLITHVFSVDMYMRIIY